MDSVGAYEKTVHSLLRIAPYRCAWCDKRFLDYKITEPAILASLTAEHPWVRRGVTRAQMTATKFRTATSRVLKVVQRTPLGELKGNSIFSATDSAEAHLQNE
jgi:hypothetical protein